MKKVKVLIVEDSKVMQQLLRKMLTSDPDLTVVDVAPNPYVAREMIKKNNPDVLTLDIMMPQMDGITFLRHLMRLRPMPVVMVSSLRDRNDALALEALALGAVDYIPKPTQKEMEDLNKYAQNLIESVKKAASTNVKMHQWTNVEKPKKTGRVFYEHALLKKNVIAIGASTGGIEAIESILLNLPKVLPPVVIVQHIRKEFGLAFSKRMDYLSDLTVVWVENSGKELLPGHVYIAQGGKHLGIIQRKDHYVTLLDDEDKIGGHKPSVDYLFASVAKAAGSYAIGVLLTGMGADGAEGMRAIHEAGGATIAQDQETSVVWGMPGAAVRLGVVDEVLPLEKIHLGILQILDQRSMG